MLHTGHRQNLVDWSERAPVRPFGEARQWSFEDTAMEWVLHLLVFGCTKGRCYELWTLNLATHQQESRVMNNRPDLALPLLTSILFAHRLVALQEAYSCCDRTCANYETPRALGGHCPVSHFYARCGPAWDPTRARSPESCSVSARRNSSCACNDSTNGPFGFLLAL